MENNGNGRVTMAVLATKLETYRDEVRSYRDESMRIYEELKRKHEDHDDRIRDLEVETAQMRERQRTSTGLLAALQLIGSAVATWLGVRN